MAEGSCMPVCWTPVPCPVCGRGLPPWGRSVPLEMALAPCCDDARHATANRRHLWSEEETDG
jgi:hypothetical protein